MHTGARMTMDLRDFAAQGLLGLCTALAFCSPVLPDDAQPGSELNVPYEPTHPRVVDAMLQAAAVGENDRVFDLGCGDGRIVIAAAKQAGARAFGVDLDPQRIREATENARFAGVEGLVEFAVGDIMAADLRPASVVTLYLLDSVNLMVRPKLFRELAPGSRVVSHAFDMGEWDPDRVVRHPKARGGRIYCWVMPARAGGRWRWVARGTSGEVSATLALIQEFSAVRGTLSLEELGPFALSGAAVEGNELRFSAAVAWGGETVQLSYRGTVDGDTMGGVEERRTESGTETHPWLATRDCVDLAGDWEVLPAVSADLQGVLSIRGAAGAWRVTYARAGDDRGPLPVSAFYDWGSSVRFEVSISGRSIAFHGVLEGDAASGWAAADGSPEGEGWWARRIAPGPDDSALVAAVAATGRDRQHHRPWSVDAGTPQPGDVYANPVDGSVLIWIPGGSFVMGSGGGAEDERPAHTVFVEGFWLGTFEVTNRQYAAFLRASDERAPLYWDEEGFNRPELPVVGVTWLEARKYCEWAGLRLPTEAEWEYAASCAGQVPYATATGGFEPGLGNARGVEGDDRWALTSPAGSFPPSCFGAYDLAGNAWEWTSSLFAPYPYEPADGREDPERHGLRVLRGGAFGAPPEYWRAAHRHRFASHLRYDYAGIRVAASLADIVRQARAESARRRG